MVVKIEMTQSVIVLFKVKKQTQIILIVGDGLFLLDILPPENC